MNTEKIFQPSYWERETFFRPRDFVVVGSGIVGLNTALELRKKYKKEKILIVEKSFLPYGASTRNAGFACFGSLSELIQDKEIWGEKKLIEIVKKRIDGIEKLKKEIGIKNIDFKNHGGYELFFKQDQEKYEVCVKKMDYYNEIIKDISGQSTCFIEANERVKNFGFKGIENMIFNCLEGQIDTGKMMKSLLDKAMKNKIEIINGLDIKEIVENENGGILIINKDAEIRAKKIIVCTNAFTKQLLPELEIIPARAQVLITSPIPALKIKGTFHFDEGYYYFRNVKNRVLFGGARNIAFKEEETTEFGTTNSIQNRLEEILKNNLLKNKKYDIDMRWSGIMAFGKEKIPIVKKVSKSIYVAARMNGMGVAIGGIIAEDVVRIICEENNR